MICARQIALHDEDVIFCCRLPRDERYSCGDEDAGARVFNNPIDLWKVRFYTLRRQRHPLRALVPAVQRRRCDEDALDEK